MGVIFSENGEILRTWTGKNRDADVDTRQLNAELTEKDDVQDAQQFQFAGFESNPPAGTKIVVTRVGDAYLISIAEDDGILNTLAEGESIAYSSSTGAVAAFVKFLNTGILELNGNNDFAVRYTALETGFNDLVNDYNSHVHTNPEGGNVGPAAPQTTADISGAKVDEVKII